MRPPPASSTNTTLVRSGRRCSGNFGSPSHRQLKARHSCGRVSWILHPRPGAQCWHHVPTGLSSACTAITLQQSVHVPQARVGARPASAAMEWGGVAVIALSVVAQVRNMLGYSDRRITMAGVIVGRWGKNLAIRVPAEVAET